MTPHQQIALTAKRQALDCLYNSLEHAGSMPIKMIAEIIDEIEKTTAELNLLESVLNV